MAGPEVTVVEVTAQQQTGVPVAQRAGDVQRPARPACMEPRSVISRARFVSCVASICASSRRATSAPLIAEIETMSAGLTTKLMQAAATAADAVYLACVSSRSWATER